MSRSRGGFSYPTPGLDDQKPSATTSGGVASFQRHHSSSSSASGPLSPNGKSLPQHVINGQSYRDFDSYGRGPKGQPSYPRDGHPAQSMHDMASNHGFQRQTSAGRSVGSQQPRNFPQSPSSANSNNPKQSTSTNSPHYASRSATSFHPITNTVPNTVRRMRSGSSAPGGMYPSSSISDGPVSPTPITSYQRQSSRGSRRAPARSASPYGFMSEQLDSLGEPDVDNVMASLTRSSAATRAYSASHAEQPQLKAPPPSHTSSQSQYSSLSAQSYPLQSSNQGYGQGFAQATTNSNPSSGNSIGSNSTGRMYNTGPLHSQSPSSSSKPPSASIVSPVSPAVASTPSNVAGFATSNGGAPILFGTKKTKSSLEDDDPNEMNDNTHAHFNLRPTPPVSRPQMLQSTGFHSIPASGNSSCESAASSASGSGPWQQQHQPSNFRQKSSSESVESGASGYQNNHQRSVPLSHQSSFGSNHSGGPTAISNSERNLHARQERAMSSDNSYASSHSAPLNNPHQRSSREDRSKRRQDRHSASAKQSPQQLMPMRNEPFMHNSNHGSGMNIHQQHQHQPQPPQIHLSSQVSASSTLSSRTPAVFDPVVVRKNFQTLLAAVRQSNVDGEYIRKLHSICKHDQTRLQQRLNDVFEDPGASDNIDELFMLNDSLCSAIEAGTKVIDKLPSVTPPEPQKKRASSSHDGPTIDLLVRNEDVFSLICMLRAQNEKRIAAALALMKFARESEMLREEIRSSGGMHSCLTLFRTNGMTRELRVVASMVVLYVLPSYIASSQASSTLGLKIMECLRFLITSRSVSTQGVNISRKEMCNAVSLGVTALWIHIVRPLLMIEGSKLLESKVQLTTLRASQSSRIIRATRGRAASTFDHGQDSFETRELMELAVMLIIHLAKIEEKGEGVEIGFNIIEQVCEEDEARPIAVREGLLKILVEWIRSKNISKIQPAASALRYLISIEDRYMAGWIHSQVVNEGAITEIVKLLNETVGHDVRVAVTQMLSALCVAPHTRAAVVEAQCISYLIALLFEHSTPEAAKMVEHAGAALLQLATGAMVHASVFSMHSMETHDSATMDKQDMVINEILEGWAHGSFIQIAVDHKGKLRSIAIEALRVLSEDLNPVRQTRLQLCNAGAGEAFGKTLKDDITELSTSLESLHLEASLLDSESRIYECFKELHEALCGLANILEPPKKSKKNHFNQMSQSLALDTRENLIKACVGATSSGGLESIIWMLSLRYFQNSQLEPTVAPIDRFDLLEEACRFLASISPLLLTDAAASKGCARFASGVLESFDGMLRRLVDNDDPSYSTSMNDIDFNALRGVGALARYEPLKIHIVDKSLPKLLHVKNLTGDRTDLSNAANQVLLSLGFTEDEISVQVTGNNPQLLVDWFCLQRALAIQAMARAELQCLLISIWQAPFDDTEISNTTNLIRQVSIQSSQSSHADDGTDENDNSRFLYEHYTNDSDSLKFRETLLGQYWNMHGHEEAPRSISMGQLGSRKKSKPTETSLVSRHIFPLNATTAEQEWILQHKRRLDAYEQVDVHSHSVESIPNQISTLLESCFPSKLIRNDIVPVFDFRPESSFNFRALMMPQRRYFSFRREGQLLSKLCEKQASTIDSDQVYWTLGFTNSTFAGEFVDSLVQTLYLCPMITGLSFTKNPDWAVFRSTDKESDDDESAVHQTLGELLANLTGSLPPWVSSLTFDGILEDSDLRALVGILETMGRLSADSDGGANGNMSANQSQGKFGSICIRQSPQISREAWSSLFRLLGRAGPSRQAVTATPLSLLRVLDLNGNKLGDDTCATILELVHNKDSGCNLEQLDLSGNRIGRGTNIVRVLRSYADYYRYSDTIGNRNGRKGWKSAMHTLALAENDLFLGQAALEIISLLKGNVISLRSLDLSDNCLEGDQYQKIAQSLAKNSSLVHIDLSGNRFTHPLVDHLLDRMNSPECESGLSFLRLDSNEPPLTESQRGILSTFHYNSRRKSIERFTSERERIAAGMPPNYSKQQDGYMDIIDESNVNVFGNGSFRINNMDPVEEPPLEPGENMITVLFSAPLVFADEEDTLHPFAKLDFDMERELLWQCLKEASRDIELSFDNAHHSRLLATLTKRCSCLHYSGHGHELYLPFEDGMGGPNWFNVQHIKELIVRDGVAPFKFVFVSACHSGLAGETFASAGVPHVVCCRQESELKDTAALAFTRQFYLALAVGHTVKESFEQGCKAVRATPNLRNPEQEMDKFVLLPKDGNHDVPVFRAKPVSEWPKPPRSQSDINNSKGRRRSNLVRSRSIMGIGTKSSELSVRNMLQEDPSPTPPQFFLGREVDMYYVLTAILKLRKRLVSILGETGMGRSSLACALCHYINERASTMSEIHRLYFIKPKHGGRNLSCRSLLRQLLEKVEESKSNPQHLEEDAGLENILDAVCKLLKNDKALIIFDRTELLEKTDEAQEFPMVLSTLLYETKMVKILLTGKNPLGIPSIGGQVEHPFHLTPLTVANTVKLFANLCPHLHTPSERARLLAQLAPGDDQIDLKPGDLCMNARTERILKVLGGGIPAGIEKAAYSMSNEDLKILQYGGLR